LIAVLSVAALAAFAVWEEWLNLVAGLWLLATPWPFNFEDSNAMTIDLLIGAAVATLAAFEVLLDQGVMLAATAPRRRWSAARVR
jgi:hypothetical protein